jgi:serine/threonine protein kinase
MPIPVALSLARDAVRGLHAIHEAGLVHRNVTPENLLVAANGHVAVHDFGLATWQHTQHIRFTPIEVLDPVYSSPDLRARLPVDARTDVFSLGVLLDQLVPVRADAPIALDAIIRRALQVDAARRFPSAQALEIALDLISLREGWLVPPSYVSSYLTDVLRSVASVVQPLPPSPMDIDRNNDNDITNLAERRAAVANRVLLPRGRSGMVGVGVTLSRPQLASRERIREHAARTLGSRTDASLNVTRVRVRR